MKPEKILDAIGRIDEKILESAEWMRNGSKQNAAKRRHKAAVRRRWVQTGLLVAAAGLIFAICFFAARVNRDDLIPVKDPAELSSETELSGEMEESSEEDSDAEQSMESETTEVPQTEGFTEDMAEDTTEAVTKEIVVIDEALWSDGDGAGAVGFAGSRDTVLHEQYTFDIRDGVLYANGQNGENGVDVNVCEGKLVVDGDTLFYVTWIDRQYHIMKMDVTTFQSEEIHAVSPKMRKGGTWQPFSLEGKLGDYLISFGYGLSSSIFSDVCLNVEQVDGSDSQVLSEDSSGAVVEDGILYYLESRPVGGEVDRMEDVLVSYDVAADKETGRALLSEGYWCEWNGCIYEARNHKTVFADGREISLPEDFYPVMIGNEMYVYSDEMICEIQYAQDAEGPIYGEMLMLEMPEETEAYQYLFREQGNMVVLQYIAEYGGKAAVSLEAEVFGK